MQTQQKLLDDADPFLDPQFDYSIVAATGIIFFPYNLKLKAGRRRSSSLEAMEEPSESRETTVEDPAAECDRDGNSMDSNDGCSVESRPAVSTRHILGALEIVERDSVAIAESYNSLFSSLRLALSEVTSTSVEHMHCFVDAAGHLQESALDAATKGNRYINSCLRLNQEMKGIENLAVQLKILRRNVDALDSSINQILRSP